MIPQTPDLTISLYVKDLRRKSPYFRARTFPAFDRNKPQTKAEQVVRFAQSPWRYVGGRLRGYLGAINYGTFTPIAESKGLTSLSVQASNCRAIFDGDLVTIRDEATGKLRYGAVFAMKNYPAITDVTMLDGLDLPIDVVVTNTFTPIPNNIMAERIQRIIRQMKASDDAAVSLREQLVQAADDQESGRIAFGNHHLSVAVYADSKDMLEKAVAQVKRITQEVSAVVVRENMALKATYFAQHPGNFSYRPRATPISSINFADFEALHGSADSIRQCNLTCGIGRKAAMPERPDRQKLRSIHASLSPPH